MIFRQIPEVKVPVYGQISGLKYEFPAFTGKITHAHTVCTRPFLLLLKGPGYEATRGTAEGDERFELFQPSSAAVGPFVERG